jgi:hypothetical protein
MNPRSSIGVVGFEAYLNYTKTSFESNFYDLLLYCGYERTFFWSAMLIKRTHRLVAIFLENSGIEGSLPLQPLLDALPDSGTIAPKKDR